MSSIIANDDEVIFSTATIEDDFADNRVLVLLSTDASKQKSAYSASDFSEIKTAKVENHTWNADETKCIVCGTPLPA